MSKKRKKEAFGLPVDFDCFHSCVILRKSKTSFKKVSSYRQSTNRIKNMQHLGLLPFTHRNLVL